ncbi:MAG: primosomal protein N' [Oscillospiraceae bacterium]|nr:primosomal protein N' [Oscillospiraceae bacterium]
MYKTADIVVENAAFGFDHAYSYAIPDDLDGIARPGCRVRVPFGRGDKTRTGMILSTAQAETPGRNIKAVAAVLDAEPLLDEQGLVLLRYLKEQTFCTWFDALRLLIPAGIDIKPRYIYSLSPGYDQRDFSLFQRDIITGLEGKKGVREEALGKTLGIEADNADFSALLDAGVVRREEELRQRILDEKLCMVRLVPEPPDTPLTKKQREAVAFLEENGDVSLKELCYYTAMTRAVPDRLVKIGVLDYYDTPRLRNPYERADEAVTQAPALSPGQAAALAALEALLDDPKPALLYGVTGSGKTEVFLALIRTVLERGRSVIVMVPEIALTAQTVRAFHARFGSRVAVLHSALSLGERMDEWKRIKAGDADIVIGTRSAVFAPLTNIGLIVMDEEQEHTYHAERSPRFHARDVARFRCARSDALLLLCSATPSVESYYHAKKGTYALVPLKERFGDAVLPDVYTVDMRFAENLSLSHTFSARLLDELHYNLEHGEQSILLLNRRGYSTLVRCPSCGAVEECPHCSVSLTYHTANASLVCHYCGFTKKKPVKCAGCGGDMIQYTGFGTQKLEEELGALYPAARVLRVDMDTTLTKFSHEKLFSAFSAGEYDIMIGTQMVAKGLHFPRVTLVGVLAADQLLYAMDFRSFERAFSLLTQVAGRSGRGTRRGRALIQTYSPDNPVIALAANQDYPGFYAQEIRSRELHLYPPFCTMAGVGFVGIRLEEVMKWAGLFLEEFRRAAADYPGLPIRVLGPVAADTLKVSGKYRQKLIVKCRNTKNMRALLDHMLAWFYQNCKTVSAFVDMYYDRI